MPSATAGVIQPCQPAGGEVEGVQVAVLGADKQLALRNGGRGNDSRAQLDGVFQLRRHGGDGARDGQHRRQREREYGE
jgi:hypothetical protein